MSGLPWYRMWTEFSRHPRTRDLCARVGDRNAGMYVVRLFEHAAEHALDGRIPARIVEDTADWRGAPGELLYALEGCSWLEVEGETRVLHGWVERNGAQIRKWLNDNAKPHGARKPRADVAPLPDETPPRPRTGFDWVDREVEAEEALPRPPASDQRGAGRAGGGKGLGPLGAAVVARVEAGLAKPLAPTNRAGAVRLEELVVALGGVEPAVDYLAVMCRTRKAEPEGVGLLVAWLEDNAKIGDAR